MDNKVLDNNIKENYTIDVLHIMKSLWRRIWLIALSGILSAIIGFSLATFLIAPKYSSSIMLYVNNTSSSLGSSDFSISSSQITAAQSLVKTYGEILNNRTTLERISDSLGLSYEIKDLSKMIKASSSNNTEIMKVTVTSEDPYEAARIANGIAEVLPIRVAEVIDGASVEIVDSAVPNLDKISPSITKYTIVGFLLGVLIVVVALVVAALLDDTIHDEEYVLQNYDCPILAKVPDLLRSGDKHYGYYQDKNKFQK